MWIEKNRSLRAWKSTELRSDRQRSTLAISLFHNLEGVCYQVIVQGAFWIVRIVHGIEITGCCRRWGQSSNDSKMERNSYACCCVSVAISKVWSDLFTKTHSKGTVIVWIEKNRFWNATSGGSTIRAEIVRVEVGLPLNCWLNLGIPQSKGTCCQAIA